MDSKSFVLLEHIYDLVDGHPFSILEAGELTPASFASGELDKVLHALTDEGYVVVKYADQVEYCLGLTPQGNSLVVDVRAERRRRKEAAEEAARAEKARQEAERRAAEAEAKAEQMRRELEAQMAEIERERRSQEEVRQREADRQAQDDSALSAEQQAASLVLSSEEEPIALQAVPDAIGKDEIMPNENARSATLSGGEQPVTPTGRMVLSVWLAGFLGAFLGGGIVGFVFYLILHFVILPHIG